MGLVINLVLPRVPSVLNYETAISDCPDRTYVLKGSCAVLHHESKVSWARLNPVSCTAKPDPYHLGVNTFGTVPVAEVTKGLPRHLLLERGPETCQIPDAGMVDCTLSDGANWTATRQPRQSGRNVRSKSLMRGRWAAGVRQKLEVPLESCSNTARIDGNDRFRDVPDSMTYRFGPLGQA
jgi:hypothetical protein